MAAWNTSDTQLAELRKRWEDSPTSHLFLQLAEEYRRRGDVDEALEVLRRGMSTPPTLAGQVALGRCLLEAGQVASARESLFAAVQRDPTQMVAYRHLIEAEISLENHGEAQRCLDIYRQLNPSDPDLSVLEGRIAELVTRSPGSEFAASLRREAPSLDDEHREEEQNAGGIETFSFSDRGADEAPESRQTETREAGEVGEVGDPGDAEGPRAEAVAVTSSGEQNADHQGSDTLDLEEISPPDPSENLPFDQPSGLVEGFPSPLPQSSGSTLLAPPSVGDDSESAAADTVFSFSNASHEAKEHSVVFPLPPVEPRSFDLRKLPSRRLRYWLKGSLGSAVAEFNTARGDDSLRLVDGVDAPPSSDDVEDSGTREGAEALAGELFGDDTAGAHVEGDFTERTEDTDASDDTEDTKDTGDSGDAGEIGPTDATETLGRLYEAQGHKGDAERIYGRLADVDTETQKDSEASELPPLGLADFVPLRLLRSRETKLGKRTLLVESYLDRLIEGKQSVS